LTRIEFPPEYIAKQLNGFCVCHFKHKEHSDNAPPHFYVTVPVSSESSLLLCIITSQIEKKLSYYSKINKDCIDSLVRITSDDMDFLSKNSIIECNSPMLILRNHLGKVIAIKTPLDIITRDIPKSVQKKIIDAIKRSPLVKPHIKNLLKELDK
jgi:hypothetical protein